MQIVFSSRLNYLFPLSIFRGILYFFRHYPPKPNHSRRDEFLVYLLAAGFPENYRLGLMVASLAGIGNSHLD